MQPKITFLGTAGGRFAVGRQLRATGGFILQCEGEQIHIDPGPGALLRARQYGVDLEKNTMLLVSHGHIDQCNDMNIVIDVMTQGGITKRGVLIGNKTVIDGTDEEHPYLTKYHRKCLSNVFSLEPGKKVGVNKVTVVGTNTKHDEKYGIGFRIITPKFTLGYTSDTGWFRGIEKEYKGCDVMVINNLRAFGKKMRTHFSSTESVNLLQKLKPKLAIIQHFGKTMLKANPMYEAREIHKQSGVPTIAATDGLQIDPLTYSSKAYQKTLGGY